MSTRHLLPPADSPTPTGTSATSATYCGVVPDALTHVTSDPAAASCVDCLTAARTARRCYTCEATGAATRGWSGNPAPDGVTCPDCRGTGIDQTRYGTGSDHCPHCAADWRRPHDPSCLASPANL